MADPKQPKQKNTPKKLGKAPAAPEVGAALLPPGHVRCETCECVVEATKAVKRNRPWDPERWGCSGCHMRAELARVGM
jgi:hypothetical protein